MEFGGFVQTFTIWAGSCTILKAFEGLWDLETIADYYGGYHWAS